MVSYTILHSLMWGFVASVPLLVGSIVALFVKLPKQIIATIMAFGSGVLIAALSFSLIEVWWIVIHNGELPAKQKIIGEHPEEKEIPWRDGGWRKGCIRVIIVGGIGHG
jgi:hypothetical protein